MPEVLFIGAIYINCGGTQTSSILTGCTFDKWFIIKKLDEG